MSSINLKGLILVFAAAFFLFSVSSCRTHNGGRSCPSYSQVAKTKKQA
jgi:hypothetical protein